MFLGKLHLILDTKTFRLMNMLRNHSWPEAVVELRTLPNTFLYLLNEVREEGEVAPSYACDALVITDDALDRLSAAFLQTASILFFRSISWHV